MSALREETPPAGIRLPVDILRCPATGQKLVVDGNLLRTNDGRFSYPIVRGVPVLVAADNEVLDQASYLPRDPAPPERGLVRRLRSRLRATALRIYTSPPTMSRNQGSDENFQQLRDLMLADQRDGRRPCLLVVGGATSGVGFDAILNDDRIDIVETDIAFGPRTQAICDGHQLPFEDGAFDGVVCQAVLEHVLDPYRVVSEIHRVLQTDGVVYSEIPFMQQVHDGAHDVTRFTLLGHRRLYRWFDEVSSGAQGGPGMALGWSIGYFLRACGGRGVTRAALWRLATLLFFWLKYFDDVLAKRPAGIDAASGTFFLGRRRDSPVPDRDVLAGYRGAGRPVATLERG
jgi:SAM-dependent methyltransferase